MDKPKYTVEELAPRLETFLGPLLRLTGFELFFDLTEGGHTHPEIEDPDVVVRFSGDDVGMLLANRAELLLALEHLTMEALRIPSEDHSRICFDANDYRMLRIEELRMSAAAAAERVKKSHVPFHFNPMSSRERRIIHLSLRNETAVRSESTGTGPIRQVVIVPAEMKTVPEPILPPPPPREGPRRDGPRHDGPRHEGGRGGGPRRDGGRGPGRGGPRRGGPPRGR